MTRLRDVAVRAKKSRQKTRLQIFTKKKFVFSKAPPMTKTVFEKVFRKKFTCLVKICFCNVSRFFRGRASSVFLSLYARSPLAFQHSSGPVTGCLGPREALEQKWKGRSPPWRGAQNCPLALLGSSMGRFETLIGCFLECLNGPFSLLKILRKTAH